LAAVVDAVPPSARRHDLIVKFRDSGNPADKTHALRNATASDPLGPVLGRQGAGQAAATGFQLLTIHPQVDLGAEIARLQKNPAVEFVEPNYPLKLEASAITPNDFEFARQWALSNPGGTDAKTNADIDATEAWAYTTGDKKVIVAVVDTGIDYFHEDLVDNLWVNQKEIPFNGIDDDGNGFVDDYYGYDFVSNDSDPFDDNEHGTHVAGIIGARGNNGMGISGVCWNVSIMAVKAFDENGNGNVSDAISAITYAVKNGARIINASWSSDEKSRALEEVCQYAADAGVLIVAAAGNSHTDAPVYPAGYDTVLAVGATDAKDARATFSNSGAYVDVAAPGVDILSTLPENGYGLLSGTSMAAPHVAGVAALVLSRHPEYGRQELFDILINSVDPITFDQPLGNGRINAARAVLMDQPLPMARLSITATLTGEIDATGSAGGAFFAGYGLFIGSGRGPTNWIQITNSIQPLTNAFIATVNSGLIPDGAAVVQLVVSNRTGNAAVVNSPVQVLNALVSYPLSGDVLSPGKFEIRGTVYGLHKTYQLSYGVGLNPTEWQPLGGTNTGQIIEGELGKWDATGLPTGYYCLRLVTLDPGSESEFQAPAIYIDHHLKPGWPVHLATDADFPTAEWRNLRVADLDGDGKAELVLIDAGTRTHQQTLMVYSLSGELLWSRELGFDIPPDIPAIGDIDGDGKMEIFVDGPNGILGFHYDGTPLGGGWPVQTQTSNHAKVLADLDGDGHLELITFSQEYSATQVPELRELAVYAADGNLIRHWLLPWCGFTNDVQKIFPAVADLDGQPGLEIVAVSGCSQISAYDYRRADPIWQANVDGTILASPVIGDVDGNGSPDIVVATASSNGATNAGVYIFNASGQRWRGWPVLEDYSFETSPALGDLDKDGRLEIVLPSTKPATLHVLQWDGFEADGWPVDAFASSTSPRLGATIADVNGDGFSDVILPQLGLTPLALTFDDPSYIGGITAWEFSGRTIPLNGTNKIGSFPMDVLNQARWNKAAPAVLGDLDGNGFLDIVATSLQERTFGSLRKVKNRSGLYAWELSGAKSGLPVEWPMLGHDAQNSGRYSLPLASIIIPTNVTRAIRDRVIAGEDRELRIEPLQNDWNATAFPLTLINFTQPTNGTVRRAPDSESALIYLSRTNSSGADLFTYTMRDTNGFTSTANVVIRIKPVDYPPVAGDMDLSVKKNASVDLAYQGKDIENERLSFRVVQGPDHGELWSYPTVATYYPAKGFFGSDSFTYVANDGAQDSLPATVRITIVNSNNPPVAVSQDLLTKTNRSIFITPGADDPDGDPLTFELVTLPDHGGSVAPENGGFRFNPDTNFLGEVSFSFRAFDGTVYGDPATVTVTVIATNATPRANGSTLAVQPNKATPLKLSGGDPDGDKISFTLLSNPLHGALSGTAPNLTYTPITNYTGPDRFTFQVSDSFANSDPATVNIQVSKQNRPPKANNQNVSTSSGVPLIIHLDASDPDQDPLRSVILKGPLYGLLYGGGTNLTYAPNAGAVGGDTFTYKVWDGQKFSEIARVIVQVNPPRDQQPPSFASIDRKNDLVELTLSLPSDKPFSIQSSTNLTDWITILGPVTSTEQTYVYRDTNALIQTRFYRAFRDGN
jgi:subtilisin family serine protease